MSGWTSGYKQCVKAAVALNLMKYVKGLIAVHHQGIDANNVVFPMFVNT